MRHPESEGEEPPGPFEDLIEEAPVAALLLDRDQALVAVNRAAAAFFEIDPERLPLGLMEATREAGLVAALTSGTPESEVRLSHRRRIVGTLSVPGPRPGQTLLFVTDLTALRRLETVRQEFVANLAHELMTPITSLRLAVESLQAQVPADQRRRLLDRALREVDNLALIITNLRQLAQLEAGADIARSDNFELRAMVDEVIDRLDLSRPIEVGVPTLWMTSDRSKLAQALTNLLDNAAKFSPEGSAVEVDAETAEGSVILRVRDHGQGISPEHWERVFERFYKVDPAHSRGQSGSGLGLSMVRHLALALGGRAWTEAADGGGQVFAIAVPVPDIKTPQRAD
ncbi:MAG TPA: ATP-binding protein [Candidatus Dormibacteraeota bacterium]|jgi:two-component system phosphate regulon sensor histidine kinase PhoR|nr:ATP-binding protein [Candidatus Dormibacteraeota bacterium]